jgi:hypothetical protein
VARLVGGRAGVEGGAFVTDFLQVVAAEDVTATTPGLVGGGREVVGSRWRETFIHLIRATVGAKPDRVKTASTMAMQSPSSMLLKKE